MKKIVYTALAILFVSVCANAVTRSKKNEISKNLDIFNALFKEMQTFYVDTINAEDAIETAIGGMLSKLDPYTEYMPKKKQEEFHELMSGEYGGIGSYIMQRNGDVYISGPQEGTPAAKAGLKPGDKIVTIDNDTVLGMSHDKVSDKLKGQPGSTVRISVCRPFVKDSMLTFDVVREKIQMPSVQYAGVVNGNIGYIYLTSFTEKSPQEVRDALLEFKKNPNVKGVVLDLRNNPGGALESAVKIVSNFVPKGTEVLRTRGKGVLNEQVYKTTSGPIMPDMPLAVLIDQGSASASEITAGALQDLDRAVIIGNRSFGKGLVQTTRQLPYEELLKVTMARYYIPSGRLIQAIDYSHRNPDGSVSRIPDSLTNVFTTAGGRTVRDGGGITPDLEVKYPEMSRITFNIMRDNWAFDYANKFASEHPTIASPDKFEITDSIYEDFKKFIDPEKFNYDKVCETILNQLREAAKIEGYMNDSVEAQFTVLEGMLKHPLEKDLDTHREAISPYLLQEIVERYYYQKGMNIAQLRKDPGFDEAEKILLDPAEYRKILSPKPTK
ncbi:MAG: S41 family peptidase [Muribaculaceae bacterium]|nr:S41 family peptidase [Muribaculaceae bacterium]